ncbi:MAG: hypothetical protein J7L07_08210 [Candidatus Odinarchaeota archaeon]|nr:hypothetical protein [Candidatus Odinarchaeota archaeon]
MPRKIDKENIKRVIDALKDGGKNWTELKRLTKLSERTLTHILCEYLKYWGIVKKINGIWYLATSLSDQFYVFKNPYEAEIYFKHQKTIVENLRKIAERFSRPRKSEKPLIIEYWQEALEHLKAFKEPYENYRKLEELEKRVLSIKNRFEEIATKSFKILGDPVLRTHLTLLAWKIFSEDTITAKFLLGYPVENAAKLILQYLKMDLTDRDFFKEYVVKKLSENEEKEILKALKAFISRLTSKENREIISELIEIIEKEREISIQFQQEILEIAKMVENYQILPGRCRLCPKIKIMTSYG